MATEQIFDNRIQRRKLRLAQFLKDPMKELSEQACKIWSDQTELEKLLDETIRENPVLSRCNQLYAMDAGGRQVTALLSQAGKDSSSIGTDRSQRPYMLQAYEAEDMKLSSLYINSTGGLSSLTAVMPVRCKSGLEGYIAAEFTLLALPAEDEYMEDRRVWLQVKGDPSIRSTLFMQSRTRSKMDEALEDTTKLAEELLISHGVFHLKLHFSSSRATVWLYDDPYRFRVNVLDEFMDAALAYPPRPYPKEAQISHEQIRQVFYLFRMLREADDTIYLRAGALNIINGMVSMNFSCDGSHYMPAEDFLEKGEVFWLGNAASAAG